MVMANGTYRTLFGWLEGANARHDAAQRAEVPRGDHQLLDDLIAEYGGSAGVKGPNGPLRT